MPTHDSWRKPEQEKTKKPTNKQEENMKAAPESLQREVDFLRGNRYDVLKDKKQLIFSLYLTDRVNESLSEDTSSVGFDL